MDFDYIVNHLVYADNGYVIIRNVTEELNWFHVYQVDAVMIKGKFPDYDSAREYITLKTK